MLPKHLRYEPEPEFNTGMVGVSVELVTGASEDSNGSNNNSSEKVMAINPLSLTNNNDILYHPPDSYCLNLELNL